MNAVDWVSHHIVPAVLTPWQRALLVDAMQEHNITGTVCFTCAVRRGTSERRDRLRRMHSAYPARWKRRTR